MGTGKVGTESWSACHPVGEIRAVNINGDAAYYKRKAKSVQVEHRIRSYVVR